MDITNQIQAILNRAGNYIHGKDSDDDNLKYESIAEWKEESETTTKQQWYKTGYDYYENETTCPATGKFALVLFCVNSSVQNEVLFCRMNSCISRFVALARDMY